MTRTFTDLVGSHCRPLEGSASMNDDEVAAQLAALPGWSRREKRIERRYGFANYWETIAFVNAIAWMIHREDHHPELVIGYDRVDVRFDTHSVGGISMNDFICAAKCDAVHTERPKAPSA